MVEATWVAVRTDMALQTYYRKHSAKEPNKAIIKVAHKQDAGRYNKRCSLSDSIGEIIFNHYLSSVKKHSWNRLQNMRGSVYYITTAIAKQAAVLFKLRPDAGSVYFIVERLQIGSGAE